MRQVFEDVVVRCCWSHVVSGSRDDWSDESGDLCKRCWEKQQYPPLPAAAPAGPGAAAKAPAGPAGAAKHSSDCDSADVPTTTLAKEEGDESDNVTLQLEKLSMMFEKGLLDADEFKAAKAKVLK